MSEPFIAQIQIWANTFAPRGWTFCAGQLMPIAQETAVFSIVGTMYGGDGRTTFGIPNLNGRSPMGWGHGPGLSSYPVPGLSSGTAEVTLSSAEIPSHDHAAIGSSANGSSEIPGSNLYFGRRRKGGEGNLNNYDANASANTDFSNLAISSTGGSQAHDNRQPTLGINFCFALQGLYPSRN